MVEGREIPKLFTAIASLSLQSQENVSILANSQDKTAPVPPLVINNAITNKLPWHYLVIHLKFTDIFLQDINDLPDTQESNINHFKDYRKQLPTYSNLVTLASVQRQLLMKVLTSLNTADHLLSLPVVNLVLQYNFKSQILLYVTNMYPLPSRKTTMPMNTQTYKWRLKSLVNSIHQWTTQSSQGIWGDPRDSKSWTLVLDELSSKRP